YQQSYSMTVIIRRFNQQSAWSMASLSWTKPYLFHLRPAHSWISDTLKLPENIGIIPIAVDDDLMSLSAILLDDGYYQTLQSAKRMVNGVPVLDETVLIPFKARAFLDFGHVETP